MSQSSGKWRKLVQVQIGGLELNLGNWLFWNFSKYFSNRSFLQTQNLSTAQMCVVDNTGLCERKCALYVQIHDMHDIHDIGHSAVH